MKGKKSNSNRNSNRLVGWLVSYQLDEQGFFHEIRAGRSMITSEKIQGVKVLSLTDKSISKPHAAVKATPRHKVLLVDIFSENGSYIQRSGSDNENMVTGPVKLEHGDWIRIGNNNRFQVCLIDGTGN